MPTVNVAGSNEAPTVMNLDGDVLTYTEADGAVLVDQGAGAAVTDVDSADFAGGNLTVTVIAGDPTEDVLAIDFSHLPTRHDLLHTVIERQQVIERFRSVLRTPRIAIGVDAFVTKRLAIGA